jgi:hypothetical protein
MPAAKLYLATDCTIGLLKTLIFVLRTSCENEHLELTNECLVVGPCTLAYCSWIGLSYGKGQLFKPDSTPHGFLPTNDFALQLLQKFVQYIFG